MSTQAAVPNPTEQIDQNISGVPTDAAQNPASTPGAPPAKEGENEHPEDEGHGKEGGYQRVKRQREEARQDAAYWRTEALRRQAADPKPAAVAAPAAVEEPEPKEEDFATVSEYLKAVRAFDRKAIVKEFQSLQSKTEQERSTKSEQQKIAETFQQRQAAAREKYADYDDVLSENVALTPAMAEVMVLSENGPDLAYWLGKNPDKAAEIAKLGPLAAARELGFIEARLAKEEPSAEPVEKPVAPITAAPRPLSTSSRPSSSTPAFDPLDPKTYKDHAEYERGMKEWKKKRNG